MRYLVRRWEGFLRLERLSSASALFKARTVYVSAIAFILVHIANGAQMYHFYHGWNVDLTAMVAASLVFLGSALSLRHHADFDLISVLWGTMILIGVGVTALMSSVGINTALIPLLVAGVVIVAILGSIRSLMIYCVSALLLVAAMYMHALETDLAVLSDPDYVALRNVQRAVQAVVGVVLVGVVMGLLSLSLNRLFHGLEANLAQSRALESARMRFLADMSHELRTPLNGVLGMNQLMMRTDLDDTQRRYAHIIDDFGAVMISLIDDILDLSRLESGAVELRETDFNPVKMLDLLAALHQASARAKSIDLRVAVEPGLPGLFTGDHGRLRQIMGNLIGNAIKFTEQGHVTVMLRGQEIAPERWWLNFFVEDTGIGIPPERQAQIFQRYERAPDDQANSVRGTGLGLAIARELTELMGGEITVVSEPGHGSRFCVAIPLCAVEHDARVDTRPDTLSLAS